MLVQTSMAHAFSNMGYLSPAVYNKAVADEKYGKGIIELDQKIQGALRAKMGTIRVRDHISLTSKTYKELLKTDCLPAWMMPKTA